MNLKILIFVFTITLFLNRTQAQYDKTMSFGIKLLPGVSTTYLSEKKSINCNRNSCSFGFDITNEIKKKSLYIQTGIFLMNRGYKENYNFNDAHFNLVTKCKYRDIEKYLTVPISLIFQSKCFYAGLGPNFGYITSIKYFVNDQDYPVPKDSIKNKFQIGAQLQVGFVKEIINNLNLSCEFYLNPVFKSKFYNYGIGIGLAYKLDTHSLHKFFKKIF